MLRKELGNMTKAFVPDLIDCCWRHSQLNFSCSLPPGVCRQQIQGTFKWGEIRIHEAQRGLWGARFQHTLLWCLRAGPAIRIPRLHGAEAEFSAWTEEIETLRLMCGNVLSPDGWAAAVKPTTRFEDLAECGACHPDGWHASCRSTRQQRHPPSASRPAAGTGWRCLSQTVKSDNWCEFRRAEPSSISTSHSRKTGTSVVEPDGEAGTRASISQGCSL